MPTLIGKMLDLKDEISAKMNEKFCTFKNEIISKIKEQIKTEVNEAKWAEGKKRSELESTVARIQQYAKNYQKQMQKQRSGAAVRKQRVRAVW